MAKASELGGMTVNERLVAIGRIDDFYAASERQDEVEMRLILGQTFIGLENIEAILRAEQEKKATSRIHDSATE